MLPKSQHLGPPVTSAIYGFRQHQPRDRAGQCFVASRSEENTSERLLRRKLSRLDPTGFCRVHVWTLVALAALAVLVGISCGPALADPPTNPGYMRAFKGRNSQFIIFDADTYEIYRSVEFRSTPPLDSHRLEIGPNGRIWVGYAESGGDGLFAFMLRDQRRGILNQSQGGMCICRVLGIGAGVSRECFGP